MSLSAWPSVQGGVKARSVPMLGWGHGLCPGESPEMGSLGSLLDAGPLAVVWGPSLGSALGWVSCSAVAACKF